MGESANRENTAVVGHSDLACNDLLAVRDCVAGMKCMSLDKDSKVGNVDEI